MLRNGLPLEATRLVIPRAVRGYAEGLGWQRIEGINGGIAVYRNPRESLRQLIVPLDEEFDDYPKRVAEAVERLAEFEGRPAREVLDHLLLPPADVIRIRERSPDAEEGNLPLEHAVRLIDGVRKALLAIAHSVLVPQPYHPRLARGEAEQFLSRCRLGQTERGSFVLMVEIHAKANLKADDYAEAAGAHLSSGLITFKGVLHRLPRLNRIDELTEFERVRFDEKTIPADPMVPF